MQLLSPNSMNEKIKYVLLIGGTNSTPNLASHRHPKSSSLPEFQWQEFPLHATRFEHRTFCAPRDPEVAIEWAITLDWAPPYYTDSKGQKSQHTLKLCKNNATLFWGYIACQKVRHTLKLCKNNAPTCASLTHTSDSNSTLDRCLQAGRNFFGGQYNSYGSLLQTVQTTVYFLPNCGTSWWCPNTKNLCLIINVLAV
jgi:hypothetical protein